MFIKKFKRIKGPLWRFNGPISPQSFDIGTFLGQRESSMIRLMRNWSGSQGGLKVASEVSDTVGKATVLVFQLGNLLVFLVLSNLGLLGWSRLAFCCQCLADYLEFCQDLLLKPLQVGVFLAYNFIIEKVLLSSSAAKSLAGRGSINYLLLSMPKHIEIIPLV